MSVAFADIVISSNAIFTGTESHPFSGSVAIKDNYILAVGTNKEIEELIGENTQVFSYHDQLVMSGFNDFHIHLFLGSLFQGSVQLGDGASEQETAEMVKEFADSRPNDEWIFGFNWYHIRWENKELPHRSTIDKVLPDRPVFLLNEECHAAWVNSKALELMGINNETEDPPFGKIVRDEHGEATGFLYETAMTFAQKIFDNIPKQRQQELLSNFLSYAAELGVTSISDMLPLPGLELGNLELYHEFEKANKLTTRIHFLSALDGRLTRAKKLREQFNSEKLKFSGLKQFLDGVPTTYTAYLINPYNDNKTTIGDTLIPQDLVKKWIIEADRENFRIRLHACGDAAVKLALDTFESAQKQNGAKDSRHTIEHIEVIDDSDINRFSELNVIASVQPEHMAAERFTDHTYIQRLGKERENNLWAFNSLLKSHTKMAFGSDFPVVDLNPFFEIHRAVTRVHDDGLPADGWNPKEKIPLGEALKIYTIGSAYGLFRENELGTLEKGKLADMIILDRNLFNIDPSSIKDTKIAMTIMDGNIVYKA